MEHESQLEILDGVLQPPREPNPIIVVAKQRIPITSPTSEQSTAHMVNRARKMNSQRSRHPQTLRNISFSVNYQLEGTPQIQIVAQRSISVV